MIKHYDLIVVGAGPAGLSAAIKAAGCGMNVIVFDENWCGSIFKFHRPGFVQSERCLGYAQQPD